MEAPAPLAALAALIVYEGAARPLVAGLKVRHNRAAQRWLAEGLARLVPPTADLVTWAPTSAARVAARGVDHARLLAEATARAAGVRCHGTLTRRLGPPQTGRSRAARVGDGPSFTARYDLSGLHVVVVDDVTTTGATLAAAGRALVAAGAASVVGLAAAATPARSPGPTDGPPRAVPSPGRPAGRLRPPRPPGGGQPEEARAGRRAGAGRPGGGGGGAGGERVGAARLNGGGRYAPAGP